MPSVAQYWPSGFYAAMNKSLAWLFARQTGQIGNWLANAELTQGAQTIEETVPPATGLVECGILSETNFETGVTAAGLQAAPFPQQQIENVTFALPPGLFPDDLLGPDGYPINASPVPLGWGPLLVNSYTVTSAMQAAINYELYDPNNNSITPGPPQTPQVVAKWHAGQNFRFGQIIVDGNGNTQMALVDGTTCASGIGNCSGNPPNWPTSPIGALTGDNTQVWKLVAMGFHNTGWLALGYCFNLLQDPSYYRVDLFIKTDVFYYQGSSSLYRTALGGNAIPGAATFSAASIGTGMIFAALYPASVSPPAAGWSGSAIPGGWVAHTNMGLGYKLANYKAQIFVKTDVEYLQEDNIPVMVEADEVHARCGSSVIAAPGTPTMHILFNDPVSGWTQVYSSLQTAAAYEALPRSFNIPTSDPLYNGNPALTNVALLENRSFIYDAALAMIAYCGAGNFPAAGRIVKQLNSFLDNPGYLATAVLEDGEDDNSASRWTKSDSGNTISDVNDPNQPPYGSGLVVDFHVTTSGDSFTYSGTGFSTTEPMVSFQHKEDGALGFTFDISVTTSKGLVTDIQLTSGASAPASLSGKIITVPIGPGIFTWRTELVNVQSLISSLASDTLSSITGFKIITQPAHADDLYFDNFSIGGLQPANSLSFSYDVYNGAIDQAYIRAGAMAWVVYAYCVYMQSSGDFTPALYAQRMINFLLTLQSTAHDDTKGLFYLGWGEYMDPGYQFVPGLRSSVSTEHQADLWFAFSRAINLLPTAAIQLQKTDQITATQAASLNATVTQLSGIIATVWTNLSTTLYIQPSGNVPGHFAQGASSVGLDVSEALDASGHWSALLADANGRDDIALQCIEFFYQNFLLVNQQILKSSISNSYNEAFSVTTPFSGFKPYNDSTGGYSGSPDSVWQEGTWGVVLALLRLYNISGLAAYFTSLGTTIDTVIQSLVSGQQAILPATGDGSLLAYSLASRGLPYEFEVWPATAPTAWMWLAATNPSLLLSVNTQPQVVPSLIIPSGQNQTIRHVDGASSVGRFTVSSIDPSGMIKSLAAQQDLIGQTATLKMGFPGQSIGDFVPLHTVEITDVGFDQRGRVQIACDDVQRFYAGAMLWPQGGPGEWLPGQKGTPQPVGSSWLPNAFRVSSDNPRWLQGNPLDLYLAAMQNELGVGQDPALLPNLTGTGTTEGLATSNPFWAKYLPGQDSTLINPNQYLDVPSILALRDGIFSGDWFEFKLSSPMQAKSWLEQYILKPLGLVTIVHANGLLSLKAMKNAADLTPVFSFTADNIIGIPQVSREPIINALTMRMDVNDAQPQTASREFDNEVAYEQSTSIYTYRRIASQQVEATGLRSARGGFLRAFLLADLTFRRYAFGAPHYQVTAFLASLPVEIGDYVSLSHPLVSDLKTGNVGISNVLCEVIGRQPDYARGVMKFDMLDTRFMGLTTPYQIAALASGIPAWPQATLAEREQYMFISSASMGGENADGSPGNTIF